MKGPIPAELRHWTAIVNPAAGHGRCGKRANEYLELLADAGYEVSILATEGPGHATELAASAVASGSRNLAALGGDGTVNEVVNGLAASAERANVRLATLPLGTGNSFLADFGLQNMSAALAAFRRGQAPPADLLRCRLRIDGAERERWLLNNIIVGFGADVGALMNRRLKPFGVFGYSLGVFLELARLRPPRMVVTLDDRVIDGPMTMINVGNSQYTGGNMRISPVSVVDDGYFDLMTAEKLSRLQLVGIFPRIFKGTHTRHPLVSIERGTHLHLSTDEPLPVLMDGDIVGTTPLEVELVPRALRVVR